MATKTEVRDRILRKLEVIAVGETASAEDADLVEDYITTVYANMSAKAKIYWTADDTPNEAVDSMVWIVADKCKREFGNNDPEIVLQAQQAMNDIAELNASEYKGEPTRACFF